MNIKTDTRTPLTGEEIEAIKRAEEAKGNPKPKFASNRQPPKKKRKSRKK